MRPEVAAQGFLRGLDGQAFAAISCFLAVGAIMNAGGMSVRLLDLARARIAHRPGGLAHVNIGARMLFVGVSGSAVADAAAVGSVMVPAMRRDGYPGACAAAVTAASATIGLVIPPSIPMVVFAHFTPADVARLFVAGVVPCLKRGMFLMVASILIARRGGYPTQPRPGWPEVWRAARRAGLALALPVLVVWGMVSGVATVSEIGAVAAVVTPTALAVGVDITQPRIVFVLAGAIGLVTPPEGVLLLVTAAQAGVPLGGVVCEGAVFLAAPVGVLAAVVLVPGLTTGVADALGL
jgi:tripartite ATP-independent transporter DctM subunit